LFSFNSFQLSWLNSRTHKFLNKSLYGLIHPRHFDAQYCDKKIFLRHRLLLAKVSSQRTTNQGTLCFVMSLPWLVLKSMAQKYLFIAILCLVWIRPNCVPLSFFWCSLIRCIFNLFYSLNKRKNKCENFSLNFLFVCSCLLFCGPWLKFKEIQNFLGKFIRFFISLGCFYRVVIHRK